MYDTPPDYFAAAQRHFPVRPWSMPGSVAQSPPQPQALPSHSRIRQPVQPCRGRFTNQLMLPCRSGGQRNMSDTTSVYQAYQGNTYLFGGNAPYVEEMYENYLANPGSVPDTWRECFDALQHVPAVDGSNAKDVPHLPWSTRSQNAPRLAAPKVVVASALTPKWAASAPPFSS